MTVHVYPSDEWACGSYRLRWPALHLAGEGFDVIAHEPGRIDWKGMNEGDTLVVQRTLEPIWSEAVPFLRSRGLRVVIDLDDDVEALHPSHPMAGLDPRPLRSACESADLVTVSTPALARYAPHGRCEVIPNMIPERYLSFGGLNTTPDLVVGWTGQVATHPGDLDVVGRSLVHAQRRHGFTFRVVGRSEGVKAALGVAPDVVPWSPLDEYPWHVCGFDVGIAPLARTKFNRAKSWLKPLEYAALGVPWIGTPTDEYRRLHELGCGVLAHDREAWSWQLRRLLSSAELRDELSNAGRQVASGLTIEGNAGMWMHSWKANRIHPRHARPAPVICMRGAIAAS